MTDVPEEVIDMAANVVAEQAEAVEDVLHSSSKIKFVYGGVGLLVGGLLGAAGAYAFTRDRAEQEANKRADDEIARMAEHYHNKVIAAENETAKESMADIVEGNGYRSPDHEEGQPQSPMAVTPPAAVVEAAKEGLEEAQPAEAKVIKEPQEHAETTNIFQEHGDADVDRSWNYAEERKNRAPDRPYIIHEDERGEMEDYQDLTITYYEADDVLCNERDEIIDAEDRERLVGEASLSRFGHGSSDPAIVYVRNDELELIYEIVRSPNSFAEEVHGFTHEDHDRRNLQRMRERERSNYKDD